MEYMTIAEASKKWGISPRRIQILCAEGRIGRITKLGFMWAIPKDAEKPKDARIRSGKFIKSKEGTESSQD